MRFVHPESHGKMSLQSLRQVAPLLLMASLCYGQEAGVVAAGKSYAPGELYLPASRVYAFVAKSGMGHDHGVRASIREGRVLLGATQNAGRLVFDMAKFDADTPDARQTFSMKGESVDWMRKQVNKTMLGKQVLNATKYPTATFEIDSATPTGAATETGEPEFELSGRLTLLGSSQPVSVRVGASEQNGWTRLRGRFTLTQSAFGMKPYSKGFGMIGVSDDLVIHGDLIVAPIPQVARAPGATPTLR